jgi:rubrerythrin
MTLTDTVSDLFALATAAEKAAMDFYSELWRMFSHVPQVGLFWEDMMRDEALHARELQEIRNTLTDERLSRPADPSVVAKARSELERFSRKLALTPVETLDDAYEIAYELESSEINAVLQAIISEFVSSEVRTNFVLSLIREHVSKLEDFSKSVVGADERRNILAMHLRDT